MVNRFTGDTALFGDMALLAKLEKIDYALLPIGGNFTMDAQDAAIAVGMLKPQFAIPIHYNTFPIIKQNPDDFKTKVEKTTPSKVIIIKPGQTIDL
jgi:L-ascorbate metabolism protein UlaG (beta-lactamase superfamily)